MKKALEAFPAILILIFTIILVKHPEHIGSAVGLVCSSFLFGYQQYLFRTEQPDLSQEIKRIHVELYNKIELSKQDTAKELTDLKTELSKFSISMARIPGVVEKPKDKIKVQF